VTPQKKKNHMVTLERHEVIVSAIVGALREVEALDKESESDYHKGRDSAGNNIQAAGAEAAVGKLTDHYWLMGVNTYRALPDVGQRTEVRYTDRADGNLILRKRDDPEKYYVLARGMLPTFEIVGWIKGSDGMQDCYWIAMPANGRAPHWLVPAEDLKPLEDRMVRRVEQEGGGNVSRQPHGAGSA